MTNLTAHILVYLMASVWILSETNFHLLQISMEFCLILLLGFLLLSAKYSRLEIVIVFTNLILAIITFAYMELNPAIIIIKNMLLSLLGYCVFSRYALRPKPIYVLTLLCVVLILIQLFVTKRFPIPLDDYLVNSFWLLESRPLGLFLAEHSSAYFMASVFFGYCLSKNMWFLDLFLISKTGVATPFFALLGAKIVHWIKPIRKLCEQSIMIPLIAIMGGLIFIYLMRGEIIPFIYMLDMNTGSSAEIIIKQMFDSNYYIKFLSILPNDILKHENDIGVPEIGYARYSIEFGTFFTISYLFLLIKRLQSWRVFILISLLHYSFVHIPLILYVMFLFQSIHYKQQTI